MAALIGSGCLAIAAPVGADPGGGGGASPAAPEQAARYSECMRANGVADFPNPNPDGHILYGGVSVSKPVWINAVETCKDLQPPSFPTVAQRTPEQQAAALKFAQCIRANGVPDFPDPATPGDPLIDTTKMRGGVSARSIPELKGAQEACHDHFLAALPPLGTNRPG